MSCHQLHHSIAVVSLSPRSTSMYSCIHNLQVCIFGCVRACVDVCACVCVFMCVSKDRSMSVCFKNKLLLNSLPTMYVRTG